MGVHPEIKCSPAQCHFNGLLVPDANESLHLTKSVYHSQIRLAIRRGKSQPNNLTLHGSELFHFHHQSSRKVLNDSIKLIRKYFSLKTRLEDPQVSQPRWVRQCVWQLDGSLKPTIAPENPSAMLIRWSYANSSYRGKLGNIGSPAMRNLAAKLHNHSPDFRINYSSKMHIGRWNKALENIGGCLVCTDDLVCLLNSLISPQIQAISLTKLLN